MNFDLMRFGRETSGLPVPPPGCEVVPTPPAPVCETQEKFWSLPGLCWNAAVMTSFGALPVQVLRKLDPLRLEDGQVQRIAWIDKIQLDEGFLHSFPDAQPILIRADALGPGLPAHDITVSPGQKVQTRAHTYGSEVRTVRDLIGRPGIQRKPETLVTYYLFHCDQPARIQVEGLTLPTAP